MSSVNDSDRNDKYKILAQEYSKLKSAFTVLKTAYNETQQSLNELKAIETGKDIQLRRQSRDIETLRFLNEQMVHRVEVLQNDLTGMSSLVKSRKHKKNSLDEDDRDVLRLELQSKVMENEDLHRKIDECKAVYEEDLNKLNVTNGYLCQQLDKTRGLLATANESYQKNYRILEQKLLSIQAEIEERDYQIDLLNSERDKIMESARVYEEKLMGDDSFIPLFDTFMNDSKLGAFDRIDLEHVVDNNNLLITKEFIHRLSNVLVCVLKDLSEMNSQFCKRCLYFMLKESDQAKETRLLFTHCGEYIDKANVYLRSLFNSTKNSLCISLASLSDLGSFMSCWKNYSHAFSNLLEYIKNCFSAELILLGSPNTISIKINSTQEALMRYNTVCQNIYDAYLPVSECSDFINENLYKHYKIESSLIETMKCFFLSLSDFSVNFDSLLSYESQLPNLSSEHILLNEGLSHSITGIWNNIKEMETVMENSKHYIDGIKQMTTPPLFCCSSANEFHQRVSSLVNIIYNQPMPQHVDYFEAVRSQDQLSLLKYSEKTMSDQIQTFRSQISILEEEKEHWMLEFQLARAKLKQGTSAQTHLVMGGVDNKLLNGGMTICDIPSNCDVPTDEREDLIRQHFNSRISNISSELQRIDSKAVFYQSECHALEEKILLVKCDRDEIYQLLKDKQRQYDALRDEFDISVREYSNQLTTMSLLNASLNEQIEHSSVYSDSQTKHSSTFIKKVKSFRKI